LIEMKTGRKFSDNGYLPVAFRFSSAN